MQQQSSELQELRRILKKEWDRPATRNSIVAVDEKVSKLVATVERNCADNPYLRDCVHEAVREKLQEDKEEIVDIKRRNNNIIIQGLQEITGEDADAWKKPRRTSS